MRTLILHIGRHKSGTKSLQSFLARNADRLAKDGVLYPVTGRLAPGGDAAATAHHDLAIRMNAEPSVVAPMLNDLHREADGFHTVVLSSEGFQNLADPSRIRFLLPGFRIVTVVYVREYVDYMLSSYQHEVKTSSLSLDLSEYAMRAFRLDMDRFMGSWSALSDVMIVRPFDPERLVGGDIVADFRARLVDFIPGGLTPNVEKIYNPSIAGNLLGFKMVANRIGIPAPTGVLHGLAASSAAFRGRFAVGRRTTQRLRSLGHNFNSVLREWIDDLPIRECFAGSRVFEPASWRRNLDDFTGTVCPDYEGRWPGLWRMRLIWPTFWNCR